MRPVISELRPLKAEEDVTLLQSYLCLLLLMINFFIFVLLSWLTDLIFRQFSMINNQIALFLFLIIQNPENNLQIVCGDFPRKDHADPPPRNVTKLFTGLLQPTLQEGTGSFVSGGPYGPEGEPPPSLKM